MEPIFETHDYTLNGKKYTIDHECYKFFYIDDVKIRENLWALFMLGVIPMVPSGLFDNNISAFKELYPNSSWNKILEKQAADSKKETPKEYVLKSPIRYIDSTKANETLKAVLLDLPITKPVLLDIWATWCGPCVKAFEYNKQLDTFLIANNIERLYVSLDDSVSEKKWHSAINKYALGGYHILANESLIIDIKKICGIAKDGGIAIPRYMLITKDKKVALNNATTPANIHILTGEIKKYLLPR